MGGDQRDPIFVYRFLKRRWLPGKPGGCRACRSDECHSTVNGLLLCCDCAPSSPAVRFLP